MNLSRLVLLAACVLSVPACSIFRPSSQSAQSASTAAPRQSAPAPRAASTPRPAQPKAAATAAPAASAHSLPSLEPQTTPSPSPSGRPEVAIPLLAPDAAPRILSVDLSETTVRSGDTVSGTVLTSSNVASVEVRVAAYGMSLAKVGVGRFTLDYPVGNLPFFVRGTYEMKIIARNSRGDTAQQSLPITVR
ncbi:MAG: hypothetical protein ABI231_09015 [Candidatus Tumulicola sp.]